MQTAMRRSSSSNPLRSLAFAASGLAVLLLAPPAHAAPPSSPAISDASIIEHGQATWYGGRHAGRHTSSGAIFDPRKMTAAHATLPLGTYVRVTDDTTGRSIVVLVNDREPPHGVRCIDLSEEAAERLGMRARGVADVTLSSASSDDVVELAEAPAPVHAIATRHGRRHTRHTRQ
jgi:rare lipoprotein A